MKRQCPEKYPIEVLRKVAMTRCTNRSHKTAIEFTYRAIVGADHTIFCADCCFEELARFNT